MRKMSNRVDIGTETRNHYSNKTLAVSIEINSCQNSIVCLY